MVTHFYFSFFRVSSFISTFYNYYGTVCRAQGGKNVFLLVYCALKKMAHFAKEFITYITELVLRGQIPCTNRADEGLLVFVGRNSHLTSCALGLNGAFIRINSHTERADVEWFNVDTISSLPRRPWCTEMVRIVLPSNSHVMTSQDSLVLQLKCTALSRNTVTTMGSSWIKEATAEK